MIDGRIVMFIRFHWLPQQTYSLIFAMLKKLSTRRNIQTPEISKIVNGLNKLEMTVTFEESLCGHENCECLVCRQKKGMHKKNGNVSYFDECSQNSDSWLLKILNGLASRDAPSLKIYIPDICFIDGDILKVFHTDIKDGRIKKIDGTLPTKAIYLTMLRLKKQYKEMLEQKFQKQILNQINPQFIHEKYMQHVLPSHFTDSEDSIRLQKNKMKFMKYVLHKDQKLLIQSIEQHKINQNQPFCFVRYKDGNSQLFSKKQFENYTLAKVSPDIVFVQSYIKQKQEQVANFTSCYSFLSTQTNMGLFNRAEKQILISIGGIGKYSEQYEDLDAFEDSTVDLMKNDVDAYIHYMTYKIVHFLAMVSRVYVKHIKINWVLNDLNMVYLQSVIQLETTELCLRTIKYRLPPKEENLVFYKDSQNFIGLYKQIQVMREAKRIKIRSQILEERNLGLSEDKYSKYDQNRSTTLGSKTRPSEALSSLRAGKETFKNSPKLAKVSKTLSTVSRTLRTIQIKQKDKDKDKERYYGKSLHMPSIDMKRRKIRREVSVLDKYNI